MYLNNYLTLLSGLLASANLLRSSTENYRLTTIISETQTSHQYEILQTYPHVIAVATRTFKEIILLAPAAPDRVLIVQPCRVIAPSTNLSLSSTCLTNQTGLLWINASLAAKGQTGLCGFPGFCAGSTSDIYNKCSNTTLLACQECGVGRTTVFLLLVICLMLAIIIGNILIICVVYKRQKQHKASKIDICRGSLAAADFITGVQMFVVVIYNFSWSMNLTPLELDAQQLTLRGSTQATVAGILFVFGYLSSLYHLVYMSSIRLFAVVKPIVYRYLSKQWLYLSLVVVWLFSITSATHPVWFPQEFLYTYFTATFHYDTTTARITNNQNFGASYAVLILLYVIPYFLLTFSCAATGILVFRNHKKQKKLFSTRSISKSSQNRQKQSSAMFITIAIMQFGFTITLLPLYVVTGLSYSGYLQCSTFSKLYFASIYLSMANCLVNVVVYSLRDKQFRIDIVKLFQFK